MPFSPQQAFDRARPGRSVIGWQLDRAQRAELLQQFPPRFAEVVADHVTLKARVADDAELPGGVGAEIIGRSDDGEGVEAMVVSVDGTTDRPDGSIYHITWSLAPGRKAKESNAVIRDHGWTPIALPMPVLLTPKRLR